MSFSGFNKNDFSVFLTEGLEERMEGIREQIQPKFKEIGAILSDDIAMLAGNEMHLHIAKHARRTVNPPKDTWLAICHDKRGYKKHPHFQVGLFDDHVFLWLAFIYEMPNKKEIAQQFLQDFDTVKSTIPDDYVISLDHMKKEAHSFQTMGETGLNEALVRFRDIKKAEFLVGQHIKADDPILQDGEQFLEKAKSTFETLIPLYKKAFSY
ncbi:YktB family protein [Alkalihalobacterium bogoriense]|uniref:YktB family protein n=1 Tax=Alkalihalobacterium bogoriense TaxID=246272 RepID=UPI00047A42D3|nr:DUF1054 domain-containing protein [Alkalihalobacterium bogoriense]